jgi:hypothetical protein
MMQIVIDIPKEMYNDIKSGKDGYSNYVHTAVRKGTPLPKGHGRLIILSEDAIKREQTSLSFSCQNWISEVGLSNATVAVIEADEESELNESK